MCVYPNHTVNLLCTKKYKYLIHLWRYDYTNDKSKYLKKRDLNIWFGSLGVRTNILITTDKMYLCYFIFRRIKPKMTFVKTETI
jgi:hypothetical protein